MSVSFRELTGSPVEIYGSGPMRATRKILVDWSDRDDFLRELLGTYVPFGGGGTANYPDRPSVIPVRVRVEAFTSDVVSAEYSDVSIDLNSYIGLALFSIDYEHVAYQWPDIEEFQLEDFTYLTHRRTGGAEAVVHKASAWKKDGDDANIQDANQVFTQRIPITEHHYAWNYVLQPPFAAINASIGKVNETVWHGYPAETVLFDSYSMDIQFIILDDGSLPLTLWQLTYVFRERRVNLPDGSVGGWQYVYLNDAGNVGWAKVTDPDGNPMYKTATNTELDNLFFYLQP